MNDHSHLRAMVNPDGAAILDTRLGRISTLNPIGAYVWRALERGESVEAIAASLAQETGEQIDSIRRDIQAFCDDLRKNNLLPC